MIGERTNPSCQDSSGNASLPDSSEQPAKGGVKYIWWALMAENGHIAKKAKLDNGLHAVHSVCLVLDYGSQYTQLIARRVRENNVYSMLLPGDSDMVG